MVEKDFKLTHALLNINDAKEYYQDKFLNEPKVMTNSSELLTINGPDTIWVGNIDGKIGLSLGAYSGTESTDYRYFTNEALNDMNPKFVKADQNILIRQLGTRYVGFWLEGDLDNVTCHYLFACAMFNHVYLQQVIEYNTPFGKWSLSNRAAIEAEYLTDGEGSFLVPISGLANDIICKPLLLDVDTGYNTVVIYHSFKSNNVVFEWFMDIGNQPNGIYINFYTLYNAI